MPLFRRFGRPGLIGLAARTAVVAGTASAVSGAMAGRRQQRATEAQQADLYEQQQQQAAADQAAQQAAAQAAPITGGGDTVNELERLAQLHTTGALSDAEFQAAKTRLLS